MTSHLEHSSVDRPGTAFWQGWDLWACALCGAAMALLLTGTVFYESRLAIGGVVSLNQLLAAGLAAVLVWHVWRRPGALLRMWRPILLILPAFVALGWSQDPAYGADKLVNLLVVSVLVTGTLTIASQRQDIRATLGVIIACLLALLLAALAYKSQGTMFCDRAAVYFMNGPIVFGWLMSAGYLLLLTPGLVKPRMLLVLLPFFLFGVVWSFSRGPQLVLLAAVLAWMVFCKPGWRRIAYVLITTALMGAALTAVSTISLEKRSPWRPCVSTFSRITYAFVEAERWRNRDPAGQSQAGQGQAAGNQAPQSQAPQGQSAQSQASQSQAGERKAADATAASPSPKPLSAAKRAERIRGSIGLRMQAVYASLDIIATQPWTGVGWGGWEGRTGIPIQYPHNLVLEALSESGVPLGLLFVLPFFAFLLARPRGNPYWLTAFFFAGASMLSGDVADARYLLCFSLLAYGWRYRPAGADLAGR